MAVKKVLVTGPSLTHKNQGDNLLYFAVGDIIRAHYDGQVEIIAFSSSKDPERVQKQAPWLNIVNPRRSILGALATLLSIDVYFIAGAIPFHDNLRLMLQQYIYALVCKLRGGKVIVNAVSVQPIESLLCRALFRWTAQLADVFSVRDEGAARNAEQLGAPTPVLRTVDPGMIYKPEAPEVVEELWRNEGLPEERKIFGIGPHIFQNHGKYFDERYEFKIEYEEYSDDSLDAYYQAMAEVADKLSEQGPVVFFALSTEMPPGDDRVASEWIISRMKNPHRAHIVRGEYSAAQLMGMLGRLDVYVSTRLHGYALAVGAGVPTVAIEFHPKMRGLAQELDIEDWVIPFEGISSQAVLDVTTPILDDLEAANTRLDTNLRTATDKAIGQIVRVLP